MLGVPNFYAVVIQSEPPLLLHYFADDQSREIHLLEVELA